MKKILVVDDDEAIRLMIADILDDPDIVLDTVSSGYRAMVSVRENKFDLILLDISMPGLDGVDTIDYVQELQPGVPIIMVTGETDKTLLQEAVNRGARAVIHKPFAGAHLRSVVRESLGLE